VSFDRVLYFLLIIRLALQACKINQILCCDWLPERARWRYLALSGLPAVSRERNFSQKSFNKSFIDQACVVKKKKLDVGHLDLTLDQ